MVQARLMFIERNIRHVKQMVEHGSYCDDLLDQIASMKSELYAISKLLMEQQLRRNLVPRVIAGDREVIEELLVTVNKFKSYSLKGV